MVVVCLESTDPFAYEQGLGLALTVADVANDPHFARERNMYAVTGVSAALFVAYYPVLTGLRCALWYTRGLLKWFPSWPF